MILLLLLLYFAKVLFLYLRTRHILCRSDAAAAIDSEPRDEVSKTFVHVHTAK